MVTASAFVPYGGDRRAEPGEFCTCGRSAIVVYLTPKWGAVGFCGLEGVRPVTPCPFCGTPEPHLSSYDDPEKCPSYRVRPDCTGCDQRGEGIRQQVNGDLVCEMCGRMVAPTPPERA